VPTSPSSPNVYAWRILGWRIASTMVTLMVLDAIERAMWTRQQEGVFSCKDVVAPNG
jgi:putative transposase